MGILKYWILTLVIANLLAGCSNDKSSISDFNKSIYIPEYASGFDIKTADGRESVLITAKNPWQGANNVNMQLLIVRNGESVPKKFSGQILIGDAKRIVTMSSTHIGMLDAIGETNTIVGVSGLKYIFSPDIHTKSNDIKDIGYEGNINYELLLSLNPDIVLIYGINGASSMEKKLQELNIPYMYIGDYLEESPLGKAEWMVAIAEILGKRENGEKAFAEIPTKYNALKKKVEDNAVNNPKVMLNIPYGDTWFMPSVNNYMVRLISDAGGNYIYKKNTGNSSEPIDLEEAYMLVSETDIWLNVGTLNTMNELKTVCPKLTDTSCFKNGKIYNNNARNNTEGGNDYFESAVVHPDLVLRDLIKIFHPGLIEEDFVYYKKLK